MRRPPRVLKLALLCSLLLHILVLWWWQTLPTPATPVPAPARATPAPVEVVVIDAPPPSRAPPASRQGPEPQKRERGRSRNRLPTGEPAAPPAQALAPLASDVPLAGPEHPSLLPSPDALVLAPDGDFPVSPTPPGPPGTRLHAPEHFASPQELVADTVRGTIARRRVESGLTHTYFNDVGRVLLGRFRQGQAEVERGMTAREKVARKVDDISSALSRSGTMEDPTAHPRQADPLVNSPSGHPALAEARRNLAYSLPYKWTHSEGVAVVRLTQAPDGKVLSIELITHSGNPGLDKAAELAIRDLGEALPPLPPEVLQGHETVVSEWKFELLRTVAGPSANGVGVVGTFDVTTGVGEALPSFAGRSQARVTLVAYY